MVEYLYSNIEVSSEFQESVYSFDLEERTFQFAARVRRFVMKLSRDICNLEDIPQLVRASGSVGANYIEANEAVSKKDFYYRIKICRKESKESRFFLRLFEIKTDTELDSERKLLMQEATEFIKIFSTILKHSPE